ncbi:MAG: hypothetical protein RIS20_1806 [Bacteroidota bacterium]|jgi:uncharacterized protein YdeI (YjbR/CyaY-like superfamily)
MKNPKVDSFLDGLKKWGPELSKLRSIALECQMEEGFKWMHPCYMYQEKNIFLIHGFKEYCAIMFMKGSLLQDAHGLLFQQTDQVQSGRQIRFTSIQEIEKIEVLLKQYIFEAIEVEKAGLKVKMKPHDAYEVVEEFQQKLDSDKELYEAFHSLTPGRQRGYLLHFSGAKQSATRMSRIEQVRSRILKGKGLTDCICGLSKRMPNCDGSHKHLSSTT